MFRFFFFFFFFFNGLVCGSSYSNEILSISQIVCKVYRVTHMFAIILVQRLAVFVNISLKRQKACTSENLNKCLKMPSPPLVKER